MSNVENAGYLKRAWTELTAEQGWWKPMAILGLVAFIPIVGLLVASGYMVDWGREAAWGMTRGPRRKADQIGRWLKWGFFAVIIAFLWRLPFDVIGALLGWIPLLGALISLACWVCSIIANVLSQVGCVNMAIYDRFKAGVQVKRICGMAKRDANGLVRCFGIALLAIIPYVIALILVAGPATTLLGSYDTYQSSQQFLGGAVNVSASATLLSNLLPMASWGVLAGVVAYLVAVATMVCEALSCRAFGYWVAQFQPAKWGGIDAAMPHEPGYVPPAARNDASAAGQAAQQATTFGDMAESAAAAAAAAGAYVKEKAGHAADAAKTAAEGFKADHVKRDDDEPIEAEVVAVEDQTAGALEGAAAAQEPEAKPSTCPNCGEQVGQNHKFCTNCGAKL